MKPAIGGEQMANKFSPGDPISVSPGNPIKRGRPRKYHINRIYPETKKERRTRLGAQKKNEINTDRTRFFTTTGATGFRLLALSDIHNNIVAVRKLRDQESKNDFDAIAIAGDFCDTANDQLATIFSVLSTFRCPIVYVYGNWDGELSYGQNFGDNCHLINLNLIKIGGLVFTGFSGAPTNWGKNPIAIKLKLPIESAHKCILAAYKKANYDYLQAKLCGSERAILKEEKVLDKIMNSVSYKRYLLEYDIINKQIKDLNNEKLVNAIRKSNIRPEHTIILTHERTYRLGKLVPNLLMHLFGHIHQFKKHEYMGTRYINVGPLGHLITVRPAGKQKCKSSDLRNLSAGNYSIIEFSASGTITIKCVSLKSDYKRWVPIHNNIYHGLPCIPEERRWLP